MKDEHDDLQRLDLNLLAVFDALLREGHLTRAGASLGMTQSATSHALKRLRDYFDDPLFVKAGRGVVPTPKGRAVGESVMGVMARVRNEVLPAAHFDPARERRTFTFCMSDMGELVFLPSLLTQLQRHAPLARVKTMQTPAHELDRVLGDGQADLALGSLRNAPEGLYQQELFTHSFVCLVHRDHPSTAATLTMEEYTGLSHIVVNLAGADLPPYDAAVDDAGIARRIAVNTPHFLLVPWLIEQNPQYIATVPRALGTVFSRHGVVVMKEPPLPLPGFSLRQYWHPRFHADAANRWLRQLVKGAFDTLPTSMR